MTGKSIIEGGSMRAKSNSRRKIRYAIVGLGHLAQVAILPAFKMARNSELVTIVSGDKEKREEMGQQYGLQHVYSYEDYDKALSTVDAVYIVVPNHLHKEYSVRDRKSVV